MEKGRTYRHEYKFLIDARQQAVLYYRLKNLLSLDDHVEQTGSYWIRSAYFDDYRNSCYWQNESGVNERTKYRIRVYGASDGRIMLERKSKKNGMTCKESAELTRDQCQMLLRGQASLVWRGIDKDCPEVLGQFLTLMLWKGYRARTIVEYERVPFVYAEGNVRITLDRNITSSQDVQHFFSKTNFRYPVLGRGQQLLEVKYDEYLPTFIRDNLEIGSLQQTSFSKYYLARRYAVDLWGGRLK